MEDAELPTYSNMAGGHLYTILLASANFPYFYRHSTNRSSEQLVHRFPFEFRGATTNAVMAQLQTKKGVGSKLPLLPSRVEIENNFFVCRGKINCCGRSQLGTNVSLDQRTFSSACEVVSARSLSYFLAPGMHKTHQTVY